MFRRIATLTLCASTVSLSCVPTAHAHTPHILVATTTPSPTPTIPLAPVTVDAKVPAPPEVSAQGWMLTDITTGKILAAGEPDQQFAPASTIKTLTALALLPLVTFDDQHTASHAEAAAEGSKAGLVENSIYTVNDLYHGLLLDSGNDTAAALANHVGGLNVATQAMNETAKKLGASNTVAHNTSGLDAPGQLTTARDLTLIARAALTEPQIAKIVSTTKYDFPGKGETFDDTRERFQIGNGNKLLRNYEGATGVKTGFTRASRHTYIGSAQRDGHHLVVTMLKAERRPWRSAVDLLDWGFTNINQIQPIGELPAVAAPTPTQTATISPTPTATPTTASPSPAKHNLLTQAAVGVGLIVVAIVAALMIARFAPPSGRRRQH